MTTRILGRKKKPTGMGLRAHREYGFFVAFLLPAFLLTFTCPPVWAADGAREALELRYHAELAIAEERAHGNRELAEAMEEQLSGLLQEYLVTRDGTIALDTVDAAFVEEQFKVARAMEEPGVALALDVFSGPGTGYEHGLQTAIANLADFNERKRGGVSEAALTAHERVMERHLDNIEQHLAKTNALADQFEDRLEAKLDATTDRFLSESVKTEEAKVEAILTRTEVKVEAVVEQTEAKVEQTLQVLEQKIEANPQNTEKAVDRTQTRIENIVNQAENKIDGIVTRAEEQIAQTSTTQTADSTTSDPAPKEKGPKK